MINGTVRENIQFGLDSDEDRMDEVIKVCSLQSDLLQLGNGLDTEIGERGINLSGGQKARISLARACFSRADICLLDDPLSAVDPHVAKNLFEDCITGYLSNRTVILVTHQIQFLKDIEHLVLLDKGSIKS